MRALQLILNLVLIFFVIHILSTFEVYAGSSFSKSAAIKKKVPYLLAPWNTYLKKIQHTLGRDPNITVGPLVYISTGYLLVISTDDKQKAQAIADIIVPIKTFCKVNLSIIIQDFQGNIYKSQFGPGTSAPPDLIKDIVYLALKDNPLFQEVVVRPLPFRKEEFLAIYPIFTPTVIQFFNDDYSNLFHTFVGIASDLFKDIFLNSICDIPITYTTGLS